MEFDDGVTEAPRIVSASIISEHEIMLTYNVPVMYDIGSSPSYKNGRLRKLQWSAGYDQRRPRHRNQSGGQVVLDLTGYPNGYWPRRTRFSLRMPRELVSGGATDNGNGVDVVGIPSEAQFVSLTDGVTVTGDPC